MTGLMFSSLYSPKSWYCYRGLTSSSKPVYDGVFTIILIKSYVLGENPIGALGDIWSFSLPPSSPNYGN